MAGVLPPQNLTAMLKGWKFEALMVGVVIVMLGQLLDNVDQEKPTKLSEPEIELPIA